MSIWNKGQKTYMFEAGKGTEFARQYRNKGDHIKSTLSKTEKANLQKQYRKNQIENKAHSESLGLGSTKTRRQRSNAIQINKQCYELHETFPKNIDFKPFVTPPKRG